MAPSKPSDVNVDDLKSAISILTDLQTYIGQPPPYTFDDLPQDITPFLASGDTGLQSPLADQINTPYHECAYTFNQSWGDLQNGIKTLLTLMNTTVAKHSGADANAQQNANSTSTGASTAGSSNTTSTAATTTTPGAVGSH